jgi:hypothetical protein
MRRGSSNGPPLLVSVFVFLSPSMHANKVSALPPAKRSSIWGQLGYGLLLIYLVLIWAISSFSVYYLFVRRFILDFVELPRRHQISQLRFCISPALAAGFAYGLGDYVIVFLHLIPSGRLIKLVSIKD